MIVFDEEYEKEKAEREKKYEKTMAIIKEIAIDRDMLKNITKDEMEQYDCPFFKLEKLEGNYIGEFDQKVRDGTIEVSKMYQEYIEKYKEPLRGFDPRTGVYGVKYAAAGFFSAGCMYMDDEKLDEATVNFAKAIELQPRHIVARGYKANCYFAQGDLVRASSEVWNAIDLNPVMLAENDKQAAELWKITHKDSKEALTGLLIEHLILRGMIQLKEESWEDALMDFDEVVKRNPNVANAYYGRLVVYMQFSHYWKFDEWDKIIFNADKCIKAKFEVEYALECRGYAYSRLENYDQAIADYSAVLAMNPDLPSVYHCRAECYHLKKDYQKAFADAEESIRRGYDDAYYTRARAYQELGEYEKALADYDEAYRRYDREDEYYDPGDDDYIMEARKELLGLMEKKGKQEQ